MNIHSSFIFLKVETEINRFTYIIPYLFIKIIRIKIFYISFLFMIHVFFKKKTINCIHIKIIKYLLISFEKINVTIPPSYSPCWIFRETFKILAC